MTRAAPEDLRDGRVHIVAGAGGRLGGAIVDRLLVRGATVIAVNRTPRRLEPSAGGQAAGRLEPCVADLSDDAAVGTVGAAIAGRPVGLVVNATRSLTPGAVLDVSPAAIAAAVDLKVGGLLRLVHAADATLAEGARLVAVGGRLGYDPDPLASAASIANAAVANLVRQLAAALGPRGVTTHVIAPGAVAHAPSDDGPTTALGHAASTTEHAAGTPLGRLPTPADVAWAVDLLLAPEAAFLNGGSLILDGGRRTAIP